MALFTFSERPYQSYEMDFRLFIEGAEVTDWCQDTVGITYAGTGNLNTLSFTLANPDDIWTLTAENIAGQWRKGTGLYTEASKQVIYKKKKAREDAGKSIIAGGTKKISLVEVGIYNLGPDQIIFHKHDCVRLFIRNPLTKDEMWMPGFTGFIDNHPFQDDYVKGGTPINFSCYDIKGLMKRMRVATNPMPGAGLKHRATAARATSSQAEFLKTEGILGPEAGPFEDLFSASGLTHPLAGRTFEQALKFLFFGEGGVLPGGAVNRVSKSLYGGLFSKTLSVNSDSPPKQSQKPSNAERKIIEEFEKLNIKDKLVIDSGGFEINTAVTPISTLETRVPRFPARFNTYLATLGSKDKTALRKSRTRAALLIRRLNDAKIRRQETTDRKKAAGQKTDTSQKVTPLSTSTQFAFKRGHVGRMEPGVTIRYPGPKKTLEEWHNLCLLGNKQGTYLTFDEVTVLGKGTVLDPVIGSPYNGKLYLLLPGKGIPASTFAQADLDVKDFQHGVSFQSRFELVNHLCEQIDYQWYVTPNGDVAVEFPMYDFTPSAFGTYKGSLTIDQQAISASMEDEASDVPTCLVVTAQETLSNAASVTDPLAKALNPNRIVVYAPLLAARLGANVEQISSPVSVGGALTGGGGKLFGGGLRGAEAWALLQLQKRLGQSSTMSMPTPYRPWMLPNRPFYNVLRERIGITQSIQHSLTIGQACQTNPVLWFVKKKHADGKFRYPTSGGENMPINYSTGVAKTGDVTKSGIIIRKGRFTGSSAGTPVGTPPGVKLARRSRGTPGARVKPDKRWLTGEAIGTGTIRRLDAGGAAGGWFRRPPDLWVVHCNSTGVGTSIPSPLTRYLASHHRTIPGRLVDGRWVCVHFVIERNGQIFQMLPLDVMGIHAGPPSFNRRSLSMEFRGPHTKTYNDAEINAYIALAKRTIEIYPTINKILGHLDITPPPKRYDPGPKFPWSRMREVGPWTQPKGRF